MIIEKAQRVVSNVKIATAFFNTQTLKIIL